MIDNTCDFKRTSFMAGFSGYNQIKMYPKDEKHTSFRTPLGVYCYTVMPFRLKNAGATYQQAMNIIFREHIRKTVECYVDVRRTCQRWSYCKSEESIQHHLGASTKNEPNQVPSGDSQWQIPWVRCDIQRNPLWPRESLCHPGNATSKKSQRTQRIARIIGVHSKIHIESIRMLATPSPC